MLTEIHISNLATIAKAHVELLKGTTVFTGETGAGKSILMDAILLGLGGRYTPHLMRANQERLDISLCFDITEIKFKPEILDNIDLQGQECIIRRIITRDGRSRTFVNDLPITLPFLREFSESLVNIHGQHEYQSLLKPDKQRELLDRFGNHQLLCSQIKSLAEEERALSQAIQELQSSIAQRTEREAFLRFQLDELEALQLQPGEWQALEVEHQQLAHIDHLLATLNGVVAILSQEDQENLLTSLHRIIKLLESIKQLHPDVTTWETAIHSAVISLDDVSSEIRNYVNDAERNPQRLEHIEKRMQIINELARKHKVPPTELLSLMEKIKLELTDSELNESKLVELQKKQDNIRNDYFNLAAELSNKRIEASTRLAKEITHIIRTLALPHAEFQVDLQKEVEPIIMPYGLEKVNFLVKTNRGSPLYPLAKIASGGELSRISLAIHLATAEQHTIPTIIFDEVDVGIGGGTAELVGKLLRRLGKTHQVLCITHHPQVAVYGNQHFSVEKIDQSDQTYTQLRALNAADKIKEIARMLGGLHITQTTLKHAQEMIEGMQLN